MNLLPALLSAVCCLAVVRPAKSQGEELQIIRHSGMSEASAAIPIGTNLVLVANDGDNRIRLYNADKPGGPVKEFDLDRWYPSIGRNTEMDLEGAARIGDRVYWIGSHSRSKEGKPRPSRQIFLATDLNLQKDGLPKLFPAGHACRTLADQWEADSRTKELMGTQTAADPDDINIEGLSATPDGGLLIGFRSPLANGKAILVPLLNPGDVLQSKPAKFGDPITLDLDGQGIRDIAWTGNEYYLIAGNTGSGGRSWLVRWRGPGHKPNTVRHLELHHLNPEGIAVFGTPDEPNLLIVSDDGSQDAKSIWQQSEFRSFWFEPPRKRR